MNKYSKVLLKLFVMVASTLAGVALTFFVANAMALILRYDYQIKVEDIQGRPFIGIVKNEHVLSARIKDLYPNVSNSDLLKITKAAIDNEASNGDFPTRYDILAVIAVESGFNCKAVSGQDSGCMQINKRFWPEFPPEAFTDVYHNITYGTNILKLAFQHNNDVSFALSVYNSGLSATKKGMHNRVYSLKVAEAKNTLFYRDM